MIQWLSIIFLIIAFIAIELIIYILYLLIKVLKIYIRKNSENSNHTMIKQINKKSVVRIVSVAVLNILIIFFIISIPYIQRNQDIYNTKNVIICNSEDDVDRFTKLLENNKLNYEIIGGIRVKFENKEDFFVAEKIVNENHIGYSVVNVN